MRPFLDHTLLKDIYLYRRRKSRLLNSLSLLVLFSLVGVFMFACGGKQHIQLALEASKYLNLDDSGAPLPVVVRIYQLKGKEQLEEAEFISLWKSDQDILGEDMLERQEITLLPDSSVVVEVDFKKGAEYLAVMALFRRPQGDNWRQIIPLKESKVRSVKISVHERSIKVSAIKVKGWLSR